MLTILIIVGIFFVKLNQTATHTNGRLKGIINREITDNPITVALFYSLYLCREKLFESCCIFQGKTLSVLYLI